MTLPDDKSADNVDRIIKPYEGTPGYKGNDLSRPIAVGNRIYELRTGAGLSAQEVEDYSGVVKANLLALEAGLLELDAATAEQLAMVLGVSAGDLLG